MSIETARKRFKDIPEVEYLPKGNRVLVYRIQGEEKTSGGLYVPDAHREVKNRGILLAAGLKALDELEEACIKVGDEVYVGRFAGDDRDSKERKEGEAKRSVWELFSEDICGSVEALERVKAFDVVCSDGTDGYEVGVHYYKPKAEAKKGRAA